MQKFIEELSNEAFSSLFIAFPVIVLIIMGIVGAVEGFVVGLHAWSIATFFTAGYYVLGGAIAVAVTMVLASMKAEDNTLKNIWYYHLLTGFCLVLVTILIALWQIHWILGLIISTVLSILIVGGIVAIIVHKEEDND